MRNPFKITEPIAETEDNYKAWMLGFLQCAFIALIGGMPILALTGQLRDVAKLSPTWIGLMVGVIGWALFFLVTQRYWYRLTYNMALILYKSDAMDRAKRAKKKAMLKSDKETRSKQE